MKNLHELDRWRISMRAIYGTDGNANEGAFHVPCPATGRVLQIIASNGGGWDHVSVSLPTRCPNWQEMDFIKRAFFKDEECAMQLHVPAADHISVHPYCLHLWRPHLCEIPRPPAEYVG